MGKTAVIFCSSSYTLDPKYNVEARNVVRCLCEKGIAVASGGTIKGTMGAVADEASKYSTGNIGIIPRFMSDVCFPNLSETYWTDSMSERKDKMREIGKDYAITLPGGIGTFDEFFETYVLAKLGKYEGKIIVYNCFGFFDNLKDLLDSFVKNQMLPPEVRELVFFPETVVELEKIL